MILLLDNFDSFTFNLVDYFGRLGKSCEVVRNDVELSAIKLEDYSGLVISPGPEIPDTSGILMALLDMAIGKLPVLGICLGHQAIGEYFGGSIVKAQKPMHGKQSLINVDSNDVLFKDLPSEFSVVRYNSLLVENPDESLKVSAVSQSGEIMGLSHNDLPVHGVQFHPEAILTEYGLTILGNWLDYYSID